jgi:NADH-quinone oxidoreductase subunit I
MTECCYIKEILKGFNSLLVGMRVTMANMFIKPHTVQWPRETAPLPPLFRGHIMMIANEKTGFPKCIACTSCARNCPSQCIVVTGKKPEGEKKKLADRFELDFTKCSLCGICVESCPVGALDFSRDYALASYTRDDFNRMDLLAGLASPF